MKQEDCKEVKEYVYIYLSSGVRIAIPKNKKIVDVKSKQ